MTDAHGMLTLFLEPLYVEMLPFLCTGGKCTSGVTSTDFIRARYHRTVHTDISETVENFRQRELHVCIVLPSGQQPPQVSRATWSVFCLVDLMNPRNSSSDTARMKRALMQKLRKKNLIWSVLWFSSIDFLLCTRSPTFTFQSRLKVKSWMIISPQKIVGISAKGYLALCLKLCVKRLTV